MHCSMAAFFLPHPIGIYNYTHLQGYPSSREKGEQSQRKFVQTVIGVRLK